MKNPALEIESKLQVLKPAHEVFEAIVDPAKMSNYFISESTGRMEEGKKLMWKFPEFDMQFPVRTGKIEQDKYISFYWDNNDKETIIEIHLDKTSDNSTVITVTEKSTTNEDPGIDWLKRNTGGWANFLACLKAYIEYGINLRKGAFEFMKGEL